MLAAGKEHGGEEIGAMHESCLPQTTRQEYRPEVEEISKDRQTQTLFTQTHRHTDTNYVKLTQTQKKHRHKIYPDTEIHRVEERRHANKNWVTQ